MRPPRDPVTRRSAIALGSAVVVAAVPVAFIAATWEPPAPDPRAGRVAGDDDATPERSREERPIRRQADASGVRPDRRPEDADVVRPKRQNRGQERESTPVAKT